jgi:hypothetical protein
LPSISASNIVADVVAILTNRACGIQSEGACTGRIPSAPARHRATLTFFVAVSAGDRPYGEAIVGGL